MGVPPDELMASLFEAIVGQNLSVLTRGNTLRPHVLLLGGPNTYIRGMVDAWKYNIPKVWEERGYPLPEGVDPKELIKVPHNAQYFAALGAVEFGKSEDETVGVYRGRADLEHYINVGRLEEKKKAGGKGLSSNPDELSFVQGKIQTQEIHPGRFSIGPGDRGFYRPRWRLDIDQGSAARQGPECPGQDLSAIERQPDRGHERGLCEAGEAGDRSGGGAQGDGRRHYRLCQGHPEGRSRGGCRAGRNRRAHRIGSAVLQRRGRHRRCRRAGHQADHSEEPPGQGLQAQHAMLGGQRLLPAIDGRRFRR